MTIGYYSIGIVAYLLGGWVSQDSLNLALSAVAPVLPITIWWLLRRGRRQLAPEASGAEPSEP